MQSLEVSGAVRHIYGSLGVKRLNSICHLLALLGAHHILHVSRVRVKDTLNLKPFVHGSFRNVNPIVIGDLKLQ